MIQRYSLAFLFCLSWYLTSAQRPTATISGYVEDAQSGEKLIAANVFDERSLQGTVTNTYGFFSLTLPVDSVRLVVSYVGYQPQYFEFLLRKDTVLTFGLSPSIALQEVEVVAARADRIERSTQMSRVDVPVRQIEKLPSLMGEVDVLKVLQLLPGVQAGSEGQNGLYIRGGSPDQNLILLDGVPVYNVSHLLGFVSVFNSDAIKTVTLTKGGYPARYGGRLSSIVEINMKEGHLQELHGEGSIGLITSRLTLEGPLSKGRSSFMVSGRRTYVDLLLAPLLQASFEEGQSGHLRLHFHDLNAKVNYKINDRHRIFLSAYTGTDRFGGRFREDLEQDDYYLTDSGIDWGNITAAARWNFLVNKKLFSNTTLTFSRFRFNIRALVEERELDEITSYSAHYFSGITDWSAKVDFDYLPAPRHTVRFGAGVTRHGYDPGAFVFKARFDEERFDTLLGSSRTPSTEMWLYGEDDITLGPLRANLGLHASAFAVQGTFYRSLQPRLGLRYLLSNGLALKASFATMTQYINLLSNEGIGLPTDLWVPSTARIAPQHAWQPALGIAATLPGEFELSIEAYYKKMTNVLSYKEGVSFIGLENDWQDKVTQGNGESYGIEFFIQKKQGRTTGWIGYTLAWSWRQFDDINGGRRYPFKYDRRHDISVVFTREVTDRVTFSATWVFGTGNAITLPLYRYDAPVFYDRQSNTFYTRQIKGVGDKNSFRMPPYHRLDFSIEFRKQKRHYERTWVFSVYNAYNRPNPFYITDGYDDKGNRAFIQTSLFPLIPAVSWNFKF
ncbi:MAG: TonB-dependent receptor [Saprospiraceae bacterium]|nr:MAG: TonB-dependent receptor [Saprospiraceae bacterium]